MTLCGIIHIRMHIRDISKSLKKGVRQKACVVTELGTINRYFAPRTKVSENATNEIRLRVLRKKSDKDSLSNLIRLYVYHTRTVCHQDKSIDRWNGVAEYL